MTGTTRSNPPGGMFDKSTFRCVGINASLDGKVTASNVDETIDVDGDKRLLSFSNVDGKITRTNVAGTGKYEGIVTAGTVENLGPFRPRTLKASAIPPHAHRIARRVLHLEPRLRRPAAVGAVRRFDTTPSSPIRQTWPNMVGPSPVRCSTNLMQYRLAHHQRVDSVAMTWPLEAKPEG